MRVVLVVVACLALAGCKDNLVETVKQQAAAQLRDPSSAQFRNVTRNQVFVCGEINGKNAYGAYVGFKRFYGTESTATIDPGDDGPTFEGKPFLKEIFDRSWASYCTG